MGRGGESSTPSFLKPQNLVKCPVACRFIGLSMCCEWRVEKIIININEYEFYPLIVVSLALWPT